MSTVFSFFLRLFLCFVAAKFLLHAIGVAGRGYLVGLTAVFLINAYWFSYLVFRDRPATRGEEGRGPARQPVEVRPEVEATPEKPAPPEE
jgi:hypothetical protein